MVRVRELIMLQCEMIIRGATPFKGYEGMNEKRNRDKEIVTEWRRSKMTWGDLTVVTMRQWRKGTRCKKAIKMLWLREKR